MLRLDRDALSAARAVDVREPNLLPVTADGGRRPAARSTVRRLLEAGVGRAIGLLRTCAKRDGERNRDDRDASDDLTSIPGFNEDLAIEAAELNDDLGSLGGFYPIVQFGVRYGLGR